MDLTAAVAPGLSATKLSDAATRVALDAATRAGASSSSEEAEEEGSFRLLLGFIIIVVILWRLLIQRILTAAGKNLLRTRLGLMELREVVPRVRLLGMRVGLVIRGVQMSEWMRSAIINAYGFGGYLPLECTSATASEIEVSVSLLRLPQALSSAPLGAPLLRVECRKVVVMYRAQGSTREWHGGKEACERAACEYKHWAVMTLAALLQWHQRGRASRQARAEPGVWVRLLRWVMRQMVLAFEPSEAEGANGAGLQLEVVDPGLPGHLTMVHGIA